MNFLKDFIANLNLFLNYLPRQPEPRFYYNDDKAAIHRFVHRRKPKLIKVAVRRQHRLDRNRYRDLSRCCRERECSRRRAKMAARQA